MNLVEFKVYRKDKPYSHYIEINPELTEKMYKYLKGNGTLWKVGCGKEVKIKYDTEHLLPVWWRDTPKCFEERFINY